MALIIMVTLSETECQLTGNLISIRCLGLYIVSATQIITLMWVLPEEALVTQPGRKFGIFA
jgi:hypothetical protein